MKFRQQTACVYEDLALISKWTENMRDFEITWTATAPYLDVQMKSKRIQESIFFKANAHLDSAFPKQAKVITYHTENPLTPIPVHFDMTLHLIT